MWLTKALLWAAAVILVLLAAVEGGEADPDPDPCLSKLSWSYGPVKTEKNEDRARVKKPTLKKLEKLLQSIMPWNVPTPPPYQPPPQAYQPPPRPYPWIHDYPSQPYREPSHSYYGEYLPKYQERPMYVEPPKTYLEPPKQDPTAAFSDFFKMLFSL